MTRPGLIAALGLIAACGAHTAQGPARVAAANHEAAQPAEVPAPGAVSTLTADVVLAKIRGGYLGGVQRCYTRYLKKESRARGRVLVSFTVDATGRTHEGAARGVAGQVEDCIVAQVARWRFPAPRDLGGAPAEASFALGLELVAD